jgi:glyceraldehyde 3-phosphate dehydrogenase
MRIAINGFGRIGRLVARRWLAGANPDLELVAINDLVPAGNLAYLLQYDSVHGRFPYRVDAHEDLLECNGRQIRISAVKDPTQLPWAELGVDLVVECTGLFTDRQAAEQHLKAGAKRVVISAPAKGGVPTFVMGVNEATFRPDQDFVISNASCTTNCLAPVAKILHEFAGIDEGLMTTVHAVTATQPTVDGPSKKDWRGGRAAGCNIIPASTGAATAVTLCLPELKGRLTGMALRVPVLDVSVVDLTVRTAKETSYEQIMQAFERASAGPLKGILSVTREELVSSDFISNSHSAIVDVGAGIELSSRFFKVVAWYDNEMGYAARLLDLAGYVARRCQ